MEDYWNDCKFYYNKFEKYSFPSQKNSRCQRKQKKCNPFSLVEDIDFVFLVCAIPKLSLIERLIKKTFPNSRIIRGEQSEIITSTGAAIHALQILNKEVEPYILPIRHPIACIVIKWPNEFKITIYDVRTKSCDSFQSNIKPIHEIADDLIVKYGEDLGKILIKENDLEPDELESIKEYSDVFHIVAEEELDIHYYLESKVKYYIGDFIILFHNTQTILFTCIKVSEGRVTWKQLDKRQHESRKHIDFEYVERMFHLKMNYVHAVFEHYQNIYLSYDSQLSKYAFKSINYVNPIHKLAERIFFLTQSLISDP